MTTMKKVLLYVNIRGKDKQCVYSITNIVDFMGAKPRVDIKNIDLNASVVNIDQAYMVAITELLKIEGNNIQLHISNKYCLDLIQIYFKRQIPDPHRLFKVRYPALAYALSGVGVSKISIMYMDDQEIESMVCK